MEEGVVQRGLLIKIEPIKMIVFINSICLWATSTWT